MVDTEFIRDQAREIEQSQTVGVVTKVYEHTDPNDLSNHEANVKLVSEDEEFRRIPIHVTRNGHVAVPQEGDFVEIGFLGGRTNRPYVASFAYDNEERAPLGRAGHWRHRFGGASGNDLFVEAEPADHSAGDAETVRMALKSDGLSDPSLAIELDASQSEPVASIHSDADVDGTDEMEVGVDQGSDTAFMRVDPGDDGSNPVEVTLDLSSGSIDVLTDGGTVRLGDRNGTFKKVARKGDSVEVQDPDSGTISGTITGGSANVEST